MMQKLSRKKPHFQLFLLLFTIFIVSTILYNELSIGQIHGDPDPVSHNQRTPISYRKANRVKASEVLDRFSTCNSSREYSGRRIARVDPELESGWGKTNGERCDVFSGKWVFDNGSYPLYNDLDCPYMSDQLACHKHGRSDLRYQYWRWQPHGCNLKRWNVKEMWEKLRGKKLMFVGDSLNRGQWISMVCLLQSVIPADKKSMTPNAELTIFRAEDYNATIEFLWAPLLVESNSDNPVIHRLADRIIH